MSALQIGGQRPGKNTSTIEALRSQYSKIGLMGVTSPKYEQLTRFLDAQDTPTLIILRDAKIKWVSALAINRINKRQRAITAQLSSAMQMRQSCV
jgi:hypothetical protein